MLDLKSGYRQMELEEASKDLTAFMVGPHKFYKYEQMPFGIINTPVTFQPVMETFLGNLQFWWHIIYLDDIIVYAATLKEHLKRFLVVLSQLWAAHLKLQPAKCEFFKRTMVYLGHMISKKGVQTHGHNVKVIKSRPILVMMTKV